MKAQSAELIRLSWELALADSKRDETIAAGSIQAQVNFNKGSSTGSSEFEKLKEEKLSKQQIQQRRERLKQQAKEIR